MSTYFNGPCIWQEELRIYMAMQYEKQGQALYFTMQWCTDHKYTVNHIAQAHFHNFLSRITEEQHMTCAEWPVCIST